MIIKIKAEAARMPCDQRCEVIHTVGTKLSVRLLGTDELIYINSSDIIGVELSETLSISFNVRTSTTRQGSRFLLEGIR